MSISEATETTLELAIDNPKEAISKGLARYHLRPHFYKKEDVDLFGRALELAGVKPNRLQYNADTLHTVWEPIRIAPNLEGDGFEKLGLLRLDLTSFFLRGHMSNVVSCSCMDPSYCGAGQLSFLMNPAWACFGMFNASPSNDWRAGGYGDMVGKLKKDLPINLLGLPNLVATANVYRGFDSGGYPSAWIGFYNGELGSIAMVRLVRYLAYKLRLRVYVTTREYCGYMEGEPVKVSSFPVASQFLIEGKAPWRRAKDEEQSYYLQAGEEVLVAENLPARKLKPGCILSMHEIAGRTDYRPDEFNTHRCVIKLDGFQQQEQVPPPFNVYSPIGSVYEKLTMA